MISWYSAPLVVIATLASMVGSALVLAFVGLPYTPLSQALNADNPYGDTRMFVTGSVFLQGADQQTLMGSTVVVSGQEGFEPVTVFAAADGSFALPLESGNYSLVASRAGWVTVTLDFVVVDDDVHLGAIWLLLDSDGECPGSVPGEGGSQRVLGVSANVHPGNSLIQDFSVQLSEPGDVWVEYFPKDRAGLLLRTSPTSDADTVHQFQVMRLIADTAYCYQVYSRGDSGNGPVADSFPGRFVTGPIPDVLADSIFNKTIGSPTYGLTLLDFNTDDFAGMVALDRDAQLVWYYQHESSVFAAAQKENLNLVFGHLNGQKHVEIEPDGTLVSEVIDVLEDGTPCVTAGRWHHESLIRPDGKVLFLGSEIQDVDIDGAIRKQTGDTIMEWDQNQGTVSTLVSLFDLLDPAVDRTPASDATGGFFWRGCQVEIPAEDWTHSNSIWVANDGSYIVSIRHLNQVIAIAPDLQSVLWRLGGPGSDFSFPDPNDQFYWQHSAKLLANGNLLLFDNGNARPEAEGGLYSRSLELELDLENMEARKVWEYRANPDLYAPCCSNTERLENGNTILVFGNDGTRDICCRINTLVEADASGSTVAVIEITSPGKGIQYRAYALETINGES